MISAPFRTTDPHDRSATVHGVAVSNLCSEDADGNDVAGVRLPQTTVPLATYTGWSLRPAAFAGDDLCDAFGQNLAFYQTQTERLAIGDTRLSIEERYPIHGAYVSAVAQAASNLHQQRLLLGEDVERIVEAAGESAVGKWK